MTIKVNFSSLDNGAIYLVERECYPIFGNQLNITTGIELPLFCRELSRRRDTKG